MVPVTVPVFFIPQVKTSKPSAAKEKPVQWTRLPDDVAVNIAAESAFSLIVPDKDSINLSGIDQVFNRVTRDLNSDQIKIFCHVFFEKLKLNQSSFFQAVIKRTQDSAVWFAIFRDFHAFSNSI